MQRLEACIRSVRATVHEHYPEWTQTRASDPGVTFAELFAFLGENLLTRNHSMSEEARASMARTLATLGASLKACKIRGVSRVNFFNGQLLTAEDLAADQQYHREKRQLHNRALHGHGIVSGLDLHIDPSGVQVSPGLALDPCGHEVLVTGPEQLMFPGDGKVTFLSLAYAERPTEPIPVGQGVQYRRIEESYTLQFAITPSEEGIPLGKFIQSQGRWRLDHRFKPPRVFRPPTLQT